MIKSEFISKWRLYLITDEASSRGRPDIEIVRDAIEGGVDVVQLRSKKVDAKTFYYSALELRKLTFDLQIPFIINDRLDIALAVKADGIHLGQKDIPADVARKLIPDSMILGVSARTVEEALRAYEAGADYLGTGPMYDARSTKPDAIDPVGPARLEEVRMAVNLPVFGIGGINAQNAMHVMRAGASGIAVISGIVSAENVREAAGELKGIVG